MIPDSEFDQLKAELKEEGSQFASSKDPKCLIGEFLCGTKLIPSADHIVIISRTAKANLTYLSFNYISNQILASAP